MAFKKYARSIVSKTNIEFDEWVEEIRQQHEAALPKDHIGRIAKSVLRKCDPKQYLLSHATIVASVDTYAPKGVKTGRLMNQGIQIDVKYPDYRIKPECHEIINNNSDAWERSLLLSTYRTFVGASSFLEHIQLPELSKGFIVDAIARDLGKTCYIDILVATDRKHKILVQDIVSGSLDSLSMGCWLPETPVTLSDGSQIPIHEVKPDMEVLTQAGNFCRVDNIQIRENRWKMVELKVAGLFKVQCTDNHGIYAVPREEIEWKKSSRRALNPVPRDYSLHKVDAAKLKVGDIVATPIPQKVENPGISESDARFIGLYVAEGYKVDYHDFSTHGVGFVVGERETDTILEIENKINQISWSSGETKLAVGGGRTTLETTTQFYWNGCYLISTRSQACRNLIDKFVHGRKAKEKCLDSTVLTWPKNLQLALLGGVIDGDGCVASRSTKHKTKSVHISTRSHDLVNQLFLISLRCGLVSVISKAVRKGTKKIPGGAGIDYQIRYRNDCAENIPSNKVKSFSGSSNVKASKATGERDRWITDNYLYSRIKSVKNFDYDGFVYDLQVDNDHSYVAGNIGVSNCVSLFTICTKCGNVASDDSNLCPCILYNGKGTKFTDEDGIEHPISELIGHVSVPNSNQFIEASWVRNPAFRGAVRRQILNPDTEIVASKVSDASKVYEIRRDKINLDGVKKAASRKIAQGQEEAPGDSNENADDALDDVDSPSSSPENPGESAESPESDFDAVEKPDKDDSSGSIDTLINKAQEELLQVLVDKLQEKLEPKPEDVGVVAPKVPMDSGNDNLQHAASLQSVEEFNKNLFGFRLSLSKLFPKNLKLIRWASKAYEIVHLGGIDAIKAARLSPKDLLILSWIEDRALGRKYSEELYKVSLSVGALKSFPSRGSFLAACKMRLGRKPSNQENEFFLWKGKIAGVA